MDFYWNFTEVIPFSNYNISEVLLEKGKDYKLDGFVEERICEFKDKEN